MLRLCVNVSSGWKFRGYCVRFSLKESRPVSGGDGDEDNDSVELDSPESLYAYGMRDNALKKGHTHAYTTQVYREGKRVLWNSSVNFSRLRFFLSCCRFKFIWGETCEEVSLVRFLLDFFLGKVLFYRQMRCNAWVREAWKQLGFLREKKRRIAWGIQMFFYGSKYVKVCKHSGLMHHSNFI